MEIIHVLDSHVADLIAAGEVVERPASATKELVENAIDAHATHITVEARGGGREFLRVTDDGCGMSKTDAISAFLRHATSKISTEEDLEDIRTLGFRGEALAAIAAVSHVELLTRQSGQDTGTRVVMLGGELESQGEAGCPLGTTIVIRDLFFNTPARLKFLKKDATELSHIADDVTKVALSHPEIAVRFLKENSQGLMTPGDGKLDSTIFSLFGETFLSLVIPASAQQMGMQISGRICKPQGARGSRNMQFFFVNGRSVRSRTLTAALEEGFKNALPSNRYPTCILYLEMPASEFDINVHPSKAEIKFSRERDAFDIVYHCVKDALRFGDIQPDVQLPQRELASPAFQKASLPLTTQPLQKFPPQTLPDTSFVPTNLVPNPIIAKQVEMPEIRSVPVFQSPESLVKAESVSSAEWRFVGEILGGYLLVEAVEALWMIDKHAAHERILFNKIVERDIRTMAQGVLEPISVSLPAKARTLLLEEEDLLQQVGFELEDFGNAILVRAAPDFLNLEDIPATLGEIAEQLSNSNRNIELRENVFRTISCKAATKMNMKDTAESLQALCAKVMEDPDLRHCPHGRPIAIRLTRSQLEKQFLR
jgi:DNA mismatch repair protein MutL